MLQVSPYHSLPLGATYLWGSRGYTATLDSPDQGATGIPVTRSHLTPTRSSWGLNRPSSMQRTKALWGDTIRGIFTQNGYFVKLNLARGEYRAEVTEEIPYDGRRWPYASGEVVLAGTLTKPKEEGNTALLLVAGSGPNNRDSQIAQHKPLYFIVDYLTGRDFLVLRYDKRGVGQSTGQFSQSMLADFAWRTPSSTFSYLKKPLVSGCGGHHRAQRGRIDCPDDRFWENKRGRLYHPLAAPGELVRRRLYFRIR